MAGDLDPKLSKTNCSTMSFTSGASLGLIVGSFPEGRKMELPSFIGAYWLFEALLSEKVRNTRATTETITRSYHGGKLLPHSLCAKMGEPQVRAPERSC